jgi:lipopolysaccharide export system protein LptA
MNPLLPLVIVALVLATPAGSQIVGKDGEVQFGAKQQRWEANSRTMYLDGEVELFQDGARLRCDHARLVQSVDSGETVTVEVTGNVYYVATDAGGETTVLKGDKGVYTRADDTLVVTGPQVIMTQGDNVMVGTRLTSQIEKGVTTMDGGPATGGRVRGVLVPRDRATPESAGTR